MSLHVSAISVEATRSDAAAAVVGVDIGGTKMAAGILELASGRRLAMQVRPSPRDLPGQVQLDAVINFVEATLQSAPLVGLAVDSIGIGLAELVSKDGRVVSDATFHWRDLPVVEMLQDRLSMPVHLVSDVHAAAHGEGVLGAGRKFESFLYVTIGTGISASLVAGGRPYVGSRGLAGVFASSPRVLLKEDGETATAMALEAYAAGPGLLARFKRYMPEFSGGTGDLLQMAQDGHPIALMIVRSAGQAVGAAVADLVGMLDPQAVIVGGGLGLACEVYAESLRSTLSTQVWSDLHRETPVLPAELGTHAGWIGAGLLAMQHSRSPNSF